MRTDNDDASCADFLIRGFADALFAGSWCHRVLRKLFEEILIQHYAGVDMSDLVVPLPS